MRGTDPADHELAFTTDDSEGVVHRVLPTFALALGVVDPRAASNPLNAVDPSTFLHAGHELVCHRELPAEGEIDIVLWADAVWDKGTAAVAVHTVCDSDPARFRSMSCRFVSPVPR